MFKKALQKRHLFNPYISKYTCVFYERTEFYQKASTRVVEDYP